MQYFIWPRVRAYLGWGLGLLLGLPLSWGFGLLSGLLTGLILDLAFFELLSP